MTAEARFLGFLGRRRQRRRAAGAQHSALRHGQAPAAKHPAVRRRQAPPEAGSAGREEAPARDARPAFYALRSGGWRDYVTLLHPPYTLWHLSYVAIAAAIAPRFDWGKLGLTLAAFFLAVGIGAHALDELMGRPLQTRIPHRTLVFLSAASIGAAVAIGIAGAIRYDLWLLAFVAFGAFIVVVYNLELLGGRFHDSLWFAVAWGAFPALTGYFAVAGELRIEAFLVAAYAFLLSLAQRRLSTVVRTVRRRVRSVSGTIELDDGTVRHIDAETLIRAPERALQLLAAATTALALALVLLHV